MKVLLISPMSESHYFVPTVGLGFLATALRKNNFNVGLIDGVKSRLTVEKLSRIILKNKPDVIGISFFSCDFSIIKEYVNKLKK